MIDFLLGLSVCLFVRPSVPLVRFGQLFVLHYANKRIVNIMKSYLHRKEQLAS